MAFSTTWFATSQVLSLQELSLLQEAECMPGSRCRCWCAGSQASSVHVCFILAHAPC
jgi:hypothetical protein